MHKSIAVFVCLLLACLQYGVQAQTDTISPQKDRKWKFGVQISGNFSNVNSKYKDGREGSILLNSDNFTPQIGGCFGFSAENIMSKNWHLHTGLLLSYKRYKNEYLPVVDYVKSDIVESYQLLYLQLPFQISYRFPITKNFGIAIIGGVQIMFGLSGKMSVRGESRNSETDEKYSLSGSCNLFTGSSKVIKTDLNREEITNLLQNSEAPFNRINGGINLGIDFIVKFVRIGLLWEQGLNNFANQKFWDKNNTNNYLLRDWSFALSMKFLF